MSIVLPDRLRRGLRLPAMAAPMFLVSGPEMVIAACKAGICGSFPANNARTIEIFEDWLVQIAREVPADGPLWAVNLMVHRTYRRAAEELELVLRHKPPIVITALGSPKSVVDAIHSYGGLVLADVNSVEYARKAAAVGVDGLVLVAAGAGGHTGQMSSFAFVPAVREFFDGIIVLGGGISSGQAVRAAEVLGADLAYIGTRLIASTESLAEDGYKEMLIAATYDDIVCSAALTGAYANWLKPSLVAAGYDPAAMGGAAAIDLGSPDDDKAKRWRDVWSAGHGVGEVKAVEPLGDIVAGLVADYQSA